MLKLAPSCFDLPRGSIYASDCSKLREVARDEKASREGKRRQARIDARAQSFLLTPLALSDPSPVASNFRRHPTNASLAPLPLESVATGHHALLLMQDLCGEMSTRETGRERGTRRKKAERGAAFFFWPAGNARFATLSFSLSSLSQHITKYSPRRCAPRGMGPCQASSGGKGAPWRWLPPQQLARARRCRRRASSAASVAKRADDETISDFRGWSIVRRCSPENSNQMMRIARK